MCDDNYINMIVHPVVSSIDGFEQGVVSTGGDTGSLTRYPRLKVREAQTQVLLKSSDTVVIGGLQNEVERNSRYGVPFLKEIPLLGRLFSRDTTTTKKIDLLILIKATVVGNDEYAAQSTTLQDKKTDQMEILFEMDQYDDPVAKAKPMAKAEPAAKPAEKKTAVIDTVEIAEPQAAAGEPVGNDEILALVRDMNTSTNAAEQ